MKYIHIHCENGYCGCDFDEALAISDETTEKEINEMVSNMAYENAESFAYVHFGEDEEYSDEEYEDYIENNIEMDWHYLTLEDFLEECNNCGIDPTEATMN